MEKEKGYAIIPSYSILDVTCADRKEAEVETSLLKTKLNIPPARPHTVPRPHLTKRLQEGLDYNLILVSAPAGFGKTTLVSEWVRQNQPRVLTAWISLDEGDNDPVRFWDYFVAAVQTLQPTCGESILPLLRSPQPPPTEPLLTALINELAEIKGDFIVALDDYHLIESQQIHEGITYLLEHMPVQMHLMIASRANPPLPLSRFRVRGKMLEIGADDLRFTIEDATNLLMAMRIPELSAEDVAALIERTEGWVAGLIMAALSMRSQKDIPAFITEFTGSQRYVMDYLVEEVLQKQSEEICDFLLKTSILARLNGPLCDAVTGRNDSRDMLLNLERGHLFLIPLDESRQWYRYEHLFADLLGHQLESIYGAEDINDLHGWASRWYEDNNLPDEAIHHALKAKDWDRAVILITGYSEKKEHIGEFVTFLNWTRKLPEEVLLSHPMLCIKHAAAMSMTGQLEASESILKTLEKATEGDDSIKEKITDSMVHIAWRRRDYALVEELAEKALSLLPPYELSGRPLLSVYLGYVYYMRGRYKEAEPLFTRACEADRQTGQRFLASGALGGLMRIVWRKGKLLRVAEMAQQALEWAGKSPSAREPHILLSHMYYEWNDLDGAAVHIQQTNEMDNLIGTMQGRVSIYLFSARIRLTQGDNVEFVKALERADLETNEIPGQTTTHADHAAYHILFAIRQGDLAAAEEWGSKLARYADALSHEYRHIPLRLLIAQGRKSEALEKLQLLYGEAVKSGMHGLMIEYRIYQALAAEYEESAVVYLSEALIMAEPEGYIRTFVDEGKLLKPLLEKSLSRGVTPAYTRKLLTIIEAEERQKMKRKKEAGTSSKYDSILSERELEVLQLMAAGLSNQQIADRLIISLSTAKNHVHNILEKLEAEGRTQAITLATKLELI